MWRNQRGQFGGWVRNVQFFRSGSDLQTNGTFIAVFNNRGRAEFCGGKTNLKEKQFLISEVTSRVNSVVVEVGWGFI